MDARKIQQTFRDPPNSARPAPFWFWNDRLDSARLIEQFDSLCAAGMGGAVLHARSGLDADEYLDERWFKAIGDVVDHAAATGRAAWLYDELGWPSGTAGGRVPRDHPEFRAVQMQFHDLVAGPDIGSPINASRVVAAFVVTKSDRNHGYQRRNDGGTSLLPDCIEYESLVLPASLEDLEGKRVLVFTREEHTGGLNYLDRQATHAFIESTHEEYYRRFGDHFGKSVRHIFMDEAGIGHPAGLLTWDDTFAERFQQRRGYDLLPHLPALLFDTPGHEAIRFDYWSLVAELFRENWAMPLHEWCEQHRVAYTGHYVFEATLKEATKQLGSAMPLYEYQGMVGIDILGNDFYTRRFEQEAYAYYVVTIKQAASVAHQLGKGGLMSESYGVGGHAMGPEAMHGATNFQLALGVTFIAHHAAFYSMRAQRKVDCPPAIGWQEPYWPYINKHFDAIARLGWLLEQGEHQCDVLLLHPASSMQATYRHPRVRAEYKAENYLLDADLPFEVVDKHFTLLSSALLDAQIDHDYGDEELMATHAAVENYRMRVGQCTYSAIVVPSLVNLRSSTLDLLKNYVSQGGLIIRAGSAPHLLDGHPSDEVRAFFHDKALDCSDGAEACDFRATITVLSSRGLRTVDIQDSAGNDAPNFKVQRRRWNDHEIVFITNIARDASSITASWHSDTQGTLEEWDANTGEAQPISATVSDDRISLSLDFAPGQERLFVIHPDATPAKALAKPLESQRISPEWRGTRMNPNILPLDTCHLHQAGAPDKLLSVSDARGYLPDSEEIFFNATFPFQVTEEVTSGLEASLGIELPDNAHVTLNGAPLNLEHTTWILDPAIRCVQLPRLSAGENEITIEGTVSEPTEFEQLWIAGDFHLASADGAHFDITPATQNLPPGAWPGLGLPFYAGTIAYETFVNLERHQFQRAVLELSSLDGSAQIRVNGVVVDHILWQPHACDITEALEEGENHIEIEVANTLRNLLGPHYDPDEEIHTGIPGHTYFAPAGTPKRFKEYGLLEAPELVLYE
jgi:glycosyl hydrolase family 106( putative alpha-L-rhamnosidase)